MKKSLYLAALAAVALTACSDSQNEVFDQSAAERLEQYKKDYADVLTADGGLWTMEYFSNEEEPGYLFVMKFDKNGSVTVSANHKWIGNEFKQETSLWTMIADNGPVLSFNSYNNLFHIFSDPANITGPNAPKGDDNEDIDETGYGHEGDYEFQLMDVSDDRNTIRLLGKKRMYHIFMRRLPADTDVQAYMNEYKTIETNLFSKEMSTLYFTDSDGERYVVNGAHTGIISIYPENGDPVDQTHSGNFVITKTGIRFLKPLEYENAKREEKSLQEFKFVNNYSLALVDDENAILNAGTFEQFIYINKCNWKVDMKASDGDVKSAFNALTDELKTLYNYKSAGVNDVTIEYNESKKSYILRVYLRTGAKTYVTDRFYITFADDSGKVKVSVGDAFDEGSQLAYNAYSELRNLIALMNASVSYSVNSECGPAEVTLTFGNGKMLINAI